MSLIVKEVKLSRVPSGILTTGGFHEVLEKIHRHQNAVTPPCVIHSRLVGTVLDLAGAPVVAKKEEQPHQSAETRVSF